MCIVQFRQFNLEGDMFKEKYQLCDSLHANIYTHLSEEDRQDDQADPVDDTGELECIVNCGHNSKTICTGSSQNDSG